MADLGTGYVDILPRTDTFLGALKGQMGDIFSKANSSLASVTKSFTAVQTAAVGAGLVAATGIAKGIAATVDWAAEVRSLQRVTGLAAEDASKLAAAGDALGIPVSKLNVAFGLLAKNITNGSTQFDKYNIATKDAAGNTLPFLDVLGNISDKFATLSPGIEQAAFAQNVFGRSGKDLIPVLQRGSDGLQELYDNAQAAGLVMGQGTLDASKDLSNAQRELGEAVKGASISLDTAFVPVLASATKILTGFVELIQLVPAPLLSMGAGFASLAAAAIIAVKAFNVLKVAMAANLPLLINFALVAAPVVLVMEAIAVHAQSMADSLNVMNATIATSVTQLGAVAAAVPAVGQAFSQNEASLIEFGVLFEHAVTVGEQAGQTFEQVAQATRDQLSTAFSKGTISANLYTKALELTGLSAGEAGALLTETAAKSDTLKVHFDKAGEAIRNFAGLTGKAMQEWASDITSSLHDTFTSLDTTIKNTFTTTPKELQKAFQQMLAATIRFKRDEEALLSLKPGTFGIARQDLQAFEKYLLDQGPAAVDAFVRSTTAQQQKIVAAWSGDVQKMNAITKGINDVTIRADTSQAQSQVQQFINATEAQRITITANVRYQAQQQRAAGGPIFPVGFAAGGSTDTVPAMLTPGEFVMRRSAVERIGLPALQKMNAGGQAVGPAWSRPQQLEGAMRILDWRNGLAALDGELAWEDAVRTR